MKPALIALASLLLTSCASVPTHATALEWFSVEADLNPGNRRYSLRITERNGRLAIEESAPGGRSTAKLSMDESDRLRARVTALQVSQSDIETLAARRVVTRGPNGEALLQLEPFDGVSYRIAIRRPDGLRTISVSNPESDPRFEGDSQAAARVRELMAFLRDISLRLRGGNRATTTSAPPPLAGTVAAVAPF